MQYDLLCYSILCPQELVEAVVLPIQHKDRFIKLGIRPPKGVLCYGPPGTGKTLIARYAPMGAVVKFGVNQKTKDSEVRWEDHTMGGSHHGKTKNS